jgi:hypothetical protein
MSRKRENQRVYNGKEYILYKTVFHSREKVEKYASNLRQKGDRVIIDRGFESIGNITSYYVYIRKGARDI